MDGHKTLLSVGAGIVSRNKRYIVWFFLLNLVFAHFGASAFSKQVHHILDRSLYADKLLHGLNLGVLAELLNRPELGPPSSATTPAMVFALLFFLVSLVFMPGVLLGYASDHGLPRDEFYRACGRNVWRFVRLLLFFSVVAGILSGILFGVQSALADAADKTSNERLPFFIELAGTAIVFLVLTAIRIWFDLAQADVVLRDEGAVRKSVAAAFRKTRRNLGRLLVSYVAIALVALVVLVAGILLWHAIVPPASVIGAFLISQATLLLLLTARFWQRATAVAFYLRQSVEADEETRPLVAFATPVVS